MGGLTDEHESVGDVVVAHVDDGGADPGTDAPLCAVQDGVHHARGLRCCLDTVQALAGVAQAVWDVLVQEILLSQGPEVEHIYTLT